MKFDEPTRTDKFFPLYSRNFEQLFFSMRRMDQFATYTAKLNRLLEEMTSAECRVTLVNAALDGDAGKEVRRLIGLEHRRRDGIFFTSSSLLKFAFEGVAQSIAEDSVIFDPACGAGDILLAAACHLPLKSSLAATLKAWSSMLLGVELHSEFSRACRARLTLAAWQRHGFRGSKNTRLANWFSGIRSGCGLSNQSCYKLATHVLMNPPFTNQAAAEDCQWANGKVSSAAVFLMRAIEASSAGTRIVAILPEVIRCGTRYSRLRNEVSMRCELNRIASFGIFDRHTDVDVFVLDVTKRKAQAFDSAWNWQSASVKNATIDNRFHVSIGTVVDFRDPKEGRWFPYINVNCIKPWDEVFDVVCRRRYSRRVVRAPFVVIRRTSRPGDKFRAVGSIVRGSAKFAVDNHLIVCKPFDNKLRTCRQLVSLLREGSTSSYLDDAIRCRHLTVDSIRKIPWVDCG